MFARKIEAKKKFTNPSDPEGKPIYAADQKEYEKKLKNRASALESRRKHKENFKLLEDRVKELETNNRELSNENSALKEALQKVGISVDDENPLNNFNHQNTEYCDYTEFQPYERPTYIHPIYGEVKYGEVKYETLLE